MSTLNILNPSPDQVILSYGDGGYITYNPKVAAIARAERDAAWARQKNRLAEDHKTYAPWLKAVGRSVKRFGQSKAGRTFFGKWADTAFFAAALHIVPALWTLDEALKTKGKCISHTTLRMTLRALYRGKWSDGNAMISDSGFFRRHRLVAVGVGTLVFLLTSPMLLVSLPLVVLTKFMGSIAKRMYDRKIRRMQGLL